MHHAPDPSPQYHICGWVCYSANQQPNIVLDNLLVKNLQGIVLVSGGETILPGSPSNLYFDLWISGYQALPNGFEGKASGFANPKPKKSASLLDGSGKWLYRKKPQYPGIVPIIATQHGIRNDGTGDQSAAINNLLASRVGSVIFFPVGIYTVSRTVHVPVGSRNIGSSWSTIMGQGTFFQNEASPQVMVQVGSTGDVGVIEITDMLFAVKGPTAGCILVEWNVHESSQGSAAMWDSHIRVDGNAGSDLLLKDCPAKASRINKKCMAAFMLMRVTEKASGYFDNMWAWVADHDLDDPANKLTAVVADSKRQNLFMGHMQTETPYYQANPNALEPFVNGRLIDDPIFAECDDGLCSKAWALRILNSTDIFLYGLGFYSFFDNNTLGCAPKERCQQSLIETNFAGRIFMHNIFAKGNVEIVSPQGGLQPIFFNSTTRNGYTRNIAAWFSLAKDGQDRGSSLHPEEDGSGVVYIDPEIYDAGSGTGTVQCFPKCTIVLPPTTLSSTTTIKLPPYTRRLDVGWLETTTATQGGIRTTITEYRSVVETTVITLPPIVTTRIEVWNVVIVYSVSTTRNAANPGYPPDTTGIKLGNTEGCEYRGTADAPGTLNCPNFPRPVQSIQWGCLNHIHLTIHVLHNSAVLCNPAAGARMAASTSANESPRGIASMQSAADIVHIDLVDARASTHANVGNAACGRSTGVCLTAQDSVFLSADFKVLCVRHWSGRHKEGSRRGEGKKRESHGLDLSTP
ncbi:putative glucan endo-1,3-beta-glucosidase [Paramyrothecium foliicola]|nr:putative glucan endo-1,3-beta-glucosidase [Paramyrothecium foliicola]